jgi:hypothetical protein
MLLEKNFPFQFFLYFIVSNKTNIKSVFENVIYYKRNHKKGLKIVVELEKIILECKFKQQIHHLDLADF